MNVENKLLPTTGARYVVLLREPRGGTVVVKRVTNNTVMSGGAAGRVAHEALPAKPLQDLPSSQGAKP